MSASSTTDGIDELADLVAQAARRLRRGSRAQLAPLGVTYAQARLMRILDHAGRPQRMANIATHLDVVPRSATSMVDSLESLGLVARQADTADRRSVLVALTTPGRELLERMDEARRVTAAELFGSLERREQAELLALLRGVVRGGAQPGDGRQACASSRGGPR